MLLLRQKVAEKAALPCRRGRHQSRAAEQKLSPGRIHEKRMPLSCYRQKNPLRAWRMCAQRVGVKSS
jgi:hypothetical protein